MNFGDGESGDSNDQGEDKNIIDKILGEMKSQFNKTEKVPCEDAEEQVEETPMDTSLTINSITDDVNAKTEVSTNETDPKESEADVVEKVNKPRIILSFKKPNAESPVKAGKDATKRAPRQKGNPDEKTQPSGLKRSARRRSKDCNESVLQSAIARKEKSYNESNRPQRLSRQLKPTQKILENLALAKQEKKNKTKSSDKPKTESDTFTDDDDRNHRRHKHKHHYSKHNKKPKKIKSDSGRDSDSDQSTPEESPQFIGLNRNEESVYRRSRRVSSSRSRDDSNTDVEEHNLQDSVISDENSLISKNCNSFNVQEELIASRLCLCTEKSLFYLTSNEEDVTYCGAVDNISDKLVGCSRTVNTQETMLMRPSARVPYTILCEAHTNRLLRHNCCPTCGIFCTEGRFVECEAKHHYHRDCQISVGNVECCPHCGASAPSHDVHIAIQTRKRPIFLPEQKAQYVSARMAFPSSYKHEDQIKCITPPLLPIGALDMQNSLQYGDEEFELVDLIAAIKNNSVEKVAVVLGRACCIIYRTEHSYAIFAKKKQPKIGGDNLLRRGSKSVDISCKIPECNDGTVLHLAAQKGYVSIVHMLLVAGAQPDTFDKDQNTPLMAAILTDSNDVVQYLIKTGATIELKGTDGMSALHVAAKYGNLKACQLLLRAATNLKNFVNSQDDGGWTPLVWACEHGYAEVANFLINKSADPFLRDVEHNVALHWAAFSGSAHIAELLLNKACDVNAVNAHGDTPLHIAARQDMHDCIIVLLARGADVTILNKNSESPLDCVPPGGDSYSPIALNITLQASIDCEISNAILSNDISKGKETNPIQCYNNVDSDPQPLDFHYVTKNCLTGDDVKIETKITSLQCCKCPERCVDDDCACGKLSVRCWYDAEGKLVPEFNFNDIPMIFECNDLCSCNAITCNNRVVQRGLTQRFELYKTGDKGWGVRTLRQIPRGSFVCEYIGEIITDLEADKRDDDTFLFDLENRVCKSASDVDTYCIDARFYGNFARFINHSCSANLTSVKVFVEHQDLRFPRIAFFANRDIESEEELSFDYGEKFWVAKYKSLSCFCGSVECKYSEDTIEMTVRNHQRRLEECG